MSSKRQIKSFWWSPDQPETKWFGSLTLGFDQTPELELFIECQSQPSDHRPLGRVIQGMDEHGVPVTLLYVGSAGESKRGAVQTRKLEAGYALIGIALADADSFVAHSLRLQVQHLFGWLARSGFKDATGQDVNAFVVNFRPRADEWFSITADLELGVHDTFKAHEGFQERSISEDAALTFRSTGGLSLARCRELIRAVRTLIHFASLEQVYPVWMTAYKKGHGRQIGEAWVEQDIEIASSNLREAKSELPFPDRWIFQFDDVRADFADFIRKWLEYSEKFAEPLGCYSSTIYHSLPAELVHLSLTQALESYHGTMFSSHRKQTFRAKIKELTNLHAASLKGLVDDVSEFSEIVRDTRNYYTHHNPKDLATGKVAKGNDLFRLNEKLQLLFQMCVLTDLGIPADRFSRLRRQLATEIISYV